MSIDRIAEWAEALTGDPIGEGCSRNVYHHRHRDDLVVKVIQLESQDPFANIMEWKIWESVRTDPKVAKWFAPCDYISPAGVILIQKKAQPVLELCNLPAHVPAFLADIKRENFGVIEDQLVCVDYAMVDLTRTTFRKIAFSV